jgi:hypothetical protein
MQPKTPYSAPPDPGQPYSNQPSTPDYSFLNDQPNRARRLPSFGNTFSRKVLFILLVLLFIVIIFIIIKSILTPTEYNKSDYLIIVERQNEMLHIFSTDVTQTSTTQLSPADQNFFSTASLSLTTAQSNMLSFLADNGDKISSKQLATVFDPTIDQTLNNSIAANDFDSTFDNTMQQQLTSYQQELKTAYSSTKTNVGRNLLTNEYQEAVQLLTALKSPTS